MACYRLSCSRFPKKGARNWSKVAQKKIIALFLHRTKSHVSVFLKRGGNMQLHVSVMFTSCGNVKIQVYVIPSLFRDGNAKLRFRHI